MVCGSIPLGFSAPLKVQLEQEIEPSQIQCNNPNHILVERVNGDLACVTEKSAQKLGWKIVENNVTNPVEQKTISENLNQENRKQLPRGDNQKMHFESRPDNDRYRNHLHDGFVQPPIFTVDMPTEVMFGETVSIDYTINWNDEDGNPLYPELSHDDGRVWLNFMAPDEIEIISDNFELRSALGTPSNSHIFVGYVSEAIPYNATEIFEGTIKIKLLEPMVYDHDDIYIGIDRLVGFNFQTVSTDDGIIIVTTADNRSDKMMYHIGVRDRYTIQFYFDSEHQVWRYWDGEIIETNDRGVPDYVYTPKTVESSAPSLEPNYIPKAGWADFAEFLRLVERSGEAEVTKEWLMGEAGYLSEEFVDDFFEAYPEFLITDTDFRSFFLPEAQAAPPKNFYAYGYYTIDSDEKYAKGGNNVSICACDTNEDGYDEKILKNGSVDVCKFITQSDGFFGVSGIDYDPDDNSSMDLKFGIILENDAVEIKRQNLFYDLPGQPLLLPIILFEEAQDVRHNESRKIIDVGNVVGLDKNHVLPYYYLETIVNAHDELYSKTKYDTPKVDIVLFIGEGIFHGPSYSHTSDSHESLANTILYPATSAIYNLDFQYTSIVLHEYGHHIQNRVYEDMHDSFLPLCETHSFVTFPTEKCGWTEGWAWFLASWLLDDPLITSTQLINNEIQPITIDLENTNYGDASFLLSDSFDGSKNEGWVAATLYDIIDSRGENSKDDIHKQESKLWKVFTSSDAQNIFEFESDWDSLNYQSLDSVFELNTIRELFNIEEFDIDITSPYNRYISSSTTITVSGETSGDVEIVSIKVYVNDILASTLTSNLNDWSVSVALPRSSNTIKVVAEDISGNTKSDSIYISYKKSGGGSTPPTGTTKPIITISSPVNGATISSDSVTVSGTASDSSEISQITIINGGNQQHFTNTSNFSYTFTGLSLGSHTFRIFAFDNNGENTSKSVTVTIASIIQTPPILNAISNTNINEGATKTITASATDSNDDSIIYSLTSSPSWVTINSNSGVITINAPNELPNSSYTVTVRTTDNDGSDSESFRITINEINQAPTLSSIGSKSVTELSALSFSLSATDSDRPSNTLRYSMVNGPTGSSINDITGLFFWTPSITQSDTYSVTFKVTDNGSPTTTDSETITITVTDKVITTSPNTTPTLAYIPNYIGNAGDTISFTVSATDSDVHDQTLSFSMRSPDGAT